MRKCGTTVASGLTGSVEQIPPQQHADNKQFTVLQTAALKGPYYFIGRDLLKVGSMLCGLQYSQGLCT